MKHLQNEAQTSTFQGELEETRMLYCCLFGDTVTDYLCALRRRELHQRGEFSCDACTTESHQ